MLARVLIALAGGSLASCRIEHVGPSEQGPSRAGLVTVTPTSAPVLPVALAAFGISEAELRRAQAVVCSALSAGREPFAALETALVELECSARAQGGSYTDALVMDGENAHWGAASQVPLEYLATEAALGAQRDDAGFRYGVEPFQSLAACPYVPAPLDGSAGGQAMPAPDAPAQVPAPSAVATPVAPATPPAMNDALAALSADEDGGVALSSAELDTIAELVPPPEPVATPMGAPPLRALVLRGPDGRYVGGLHVRGPRMLELPGSRDGPIGVQAMPGQVLHVDRDGVVLVEHPHWHDLALAPAAATLGYAALRDKRALPHDVLIALSDDQPQPIVRYGALAHTFPLGECGSKQRGAR